MKVIYIKTLKDKPETCGSCPVSNNSRRCVILWREFGNPDEVFPDCPLGEVEVEEDKA